MNCARSGKGLSHLRLHSGAFSPLLYTVGMVEMVGIRRTINLFRGDSSCVRCSDERATSTKERESVEDSLKRTASTRGDTKNRTTGN